MEIQTQTWNVGELGFTVDTAGPEAGVPVLMLHGFPQNRHMWSHQLYALAAAGFHAIAPDQRGYSRGARPSAIEAYTTDQLTRDALNLMDACGAQRFHLVAHDWGGQLAWLIAAGHPDRVTSLTVLSRPHPAAFTQAMTEDPEQANRSRHHKGFREPDAIALLRQDNFKSLRKGLEHEGIVAADVDVYLRTLAEDGALESAINWYRANTLASAIGPIAPPTLYIWGTADASVGRRAAELTAPFVTVRIASSRLRAVGTLSLINSPTESRSFCLSSCAPPPSEYPLTGGFQPLRRR
ncbi:MAG TPA: alpha/beta hydrolase [Candidatus Binataceae bacterium]|nr:alpha/beta hydrolase [Candidatus Binataceae bacterium]